MEPELHAGSTLVSAINCYLKELVSMRPFLLQRYSDILEPMAQQWLADIGINRLDAIDGQWLGRYIATSNDRGIAMNACQDFYRWAIQHSLIAENPLGNFVQ